MVGEWAPQERQRHVVDRHAGRRPPLRRAAVRVAVERRGYRVAIERIFEPARAQERRDLRRLVRHGGANGRVVEQRDAMGRSQPRERALELERLFHRLTDKLFEHGFAPRLQRALAEAAGEALDAGEPYAPDLDRIAVEHRDAAVGEDLLYCVGLLA